MEADFTQLSPSIAGQPFPSPESRPNAYLAPHTGFGINLESESVSVTPYLLGDSSTTNHQARPKDTNIILRRAAGEDPITGLKTMNPTANGLANTSKKPQRLARRGPSEPHYKDSYWAEWTSEDAGLGSFSAAPTMQVVREGQRIVFDIHRAVSVFNVRGGSNWTSDDLRKDLKKFMSLPTRSMFMAKNKAPSAGSVPVTISYRNESAFNLDGIDSVKRASPSDVTIVSSNTAVLGESPNSGLSPARPDVEFKPGRVVIEINRDAKDEGDEYFFLEVGDPGEPKYYGFVIREPKKLTAFELFKGTSIAKLIGLPTAEKFAKEFSQSLSKGFNNWAEDSTKKMLDYFHRKRLLEQKRLSPLEIIKLKQNLIRHQTANGGGVRG